MSVMILCKDSGLNKDFQWCDCTIRLGHNDGEESDGAVGVTEPGAVEAE